MDIDPAKIAPKDFYQYMIACITPRPIAWVSTVSPRGVANLAPFSFYNGVAANPPTVVL
jgi:flavin reductase (DIM6/NTAB) family NADH-FMN oxidoreductase RutF